MVKSRLDWANTTGSAEKWWRAFEEENSEKLNLVIALAEQLDTRQATITEFFLAYVYSNCENINANLHYLDFTRTNKKVGKMKREAAQELDFNASTYLQIDLPESALGNPEGAADDQMLKTFLDRMKSEMGLDAIDPIGGALINQWWETLEEKYSARILVWLFAELRRRNVKIKDYYEAYLLSNCDNLQANLHYLDYLVLKTEERKWKPPEILQDPLRATLSNRTRDEVILFRTEMFRKTLEEYRLAEEAVANPISSETFSEAVETLPFTASPVEFHLIESSSDKPTEPVSCLIRCQACRTLLFAASPKCRMCGMVLDGAGFGLEDREVSDDERLQHEKHFQSEMERWCFGISDYPGEIYSEIVFGIIGDALAQAIDHAIRHSVIFDVLDDSSKISKAAKYLVDERDIAFEILNSLPHPDSLNESESFIVAQIVDQVEQSYGGAIDFVESQWQSNHHFPRR